MRRLVKLILNYIPRTILTRLSFILKPLIRIYLYGNKYTDPIDGSSFRKFLPYGYNNVRKNALSPSTFSLERHRLLWLYLENETPFFKKKLKDFFCENLTNLKNKGKKILLFNTCKANKNADFFKISNFDNL